MCGRILQISASRGGIPKLAVLAGYIGWTGLDGDACRNTRYHGGPNQALLLITSEGIDELRSLGFDIFAGALGENLTTTGIDRRGLRVGQSFFVGSAVIKLTKVRTPCRTLNPYGRGIHEAIYDARVKTADIASPRWGLSGFYAKVVRPGAVRTGDIIASVESVSHLHATSA